MIGKLTGKSMENQAKVIRKYMRISFDNQRECRWEFYQRIFGICTTTSFVKRTGNSWDHIRVTHWNICERSLENVRESHLNVFRRSLGNVSESQWKAYGKVRVKSVGKSLENLRTDIGKSTEAH